MEMGEWASVNGAVVGQRSGRQETTMARAGTLPENAYYEDLVPANNNIGTNTKRNYLPGWTFLYVWSYCHNQSSIYTITRHHHVSC